MKQELSYAFQKSFFRVVSTLRSRKTTSQQQKNRKSSLMKLFSEENEEIAGISR